MLKLFAVIGLLLISATVGAQAQTRWDLPSPFADDSFQTRNLQEFVKDVDGRTNGTLKITIHSNQSLIRHEDMMDALRRGIVPIGEIMLSRFDKLNPVYGADAVPFLASGYDAAWKLYQAQKPVLQKIFDREKLILMFSAPWPPQGFYSTKQINAVEDIKGLKFRTYDKASESLARALGATPVTIADADLPNALASGEADIVMIAPSTGAVAFAAGDAPVLYYDVQAWLPRDVVLVNKDHFGGLSDGERRALTEASGTAEGRGWDLSKAAAKAQLDALAKAGVKVVQPSDALKQGLADIGRALTEEWLRAAGQDGKAILDAYSKK